ncbi:AMP-binding protein [Hamadaea tsunoensis]|uniref:AMP-binding protein n=1 Tax=Hamadaea tsunoensis TaxID=53368 RepID=UPI000687A086|nr:AMP-binding protein [Hamadaea tsunoensis]
MPDASERALVPFVRDLEMFGDRPALITETDTVSYQDLAARAYAVAARLGPVRRLVAVTGGNTVDAIATYLGALHGGHTVLLLGGDSEAIVDRYDPDVLAGPDGNWRLDVRRPGSAHTLHPDLALLLSTSGSTGSPKLVRLSHDNLQSNATAIAAYLGIGLGDRAATSLPMHYCYGLSVIHSHLLAGAGIILTDLSVSEHRFWDLFRQAHGTAFAGVPYTFDLLDQIGFADLDLPDLRYVTQAGGRLAPDRVTRYAELGRAHGWDLVVMYGQTEATARMAYLPPRLAATRPEAIGIPVPGGSFRIDVDPEDGLGELVYQGPNVMLGYAESPADLALGREVDELRTGDLARLADDGLYEIVGRRSRFLKLFGLRIDLSQVEDFVRRTGVDAACAGTDDHLVVAVAGRPGADDLTRLLTTQFKLPAHALSVHVLDELPRLATGKIDYTAVVDLAVRQGARSDGATDVVTAVCDLYADMLRRPVRRTDTFSGLGGDSLSFVQTSIRLERLIGRLPQDWQHATIQDLAEAPRPASRRRATIEVSVALRAAAIVAVVLVHSKVLMAVGGAHLMLGIAGFNLARFQLDDAPALQRVRRVLSSLTRIVLPMIVWVALIIVTVGDYSPINLYLGYYLTGAVNAHHEAQLWFIEVIVFYTLGALLLVTNPWGYRLERRFRFALPMVLVGLGLLTRYDLVPGMTASPWVSSQVTPLMVIWIFALGWATARADKIWQKLLLTAIILVTMADYFMYPMQQEIVTAGLLLLVWVRTLPSFPLLNKVLGTLAASSLLIYVTHYQVFPRFAWIAQPNIIGVVISLLFGVGCAALVQRLPSPARLFSRTRAAKPEWAQM